MAFRVYKLPRKRGDRQVRTYQTEPDELLLGSLAREFGPVVVLTEEEYQKEQKQ